MFVFLITNNAQNINIESNVNSLLPSVGNSVIFFKEMLMIFPSTCKLLIIPKIVVKKRARNVFVIPALQLLPHASKDVFRI